MVPFLRALAGFVLSLAVLAGCAPPRAGNCDLVLLAQAPLRPHQQLLAVPVGINGQWATLIVDTGAERTTLTEDAVERLGLARDPRYVTRSGGVGGVTMNADVKVDDFVLGGTRLPVERLAVSRFGAGLQADGLLGADILLAFDLDIDVPGGKLSLYRVRRCPVANPPWDEPAVPVAAVAARKDRLLVPFTLDGAPGMALLDTGAQATAIGVDMARRMGLALQPQGSDPVVRIRGVGSATMTARLHLFRELRIGPAAWRNIRLPILPEDVGIGDALVGQDFLRDRRVWISFPTRQMFVSRLAHEVPRP
ncbi:MAG: retropepsin-like aspartic protease [Acetobacteraceae bacterium]